MTEKPDLLPYQYFLNDIEFIQAKSKAKIEQNLDEDHITKMTHVVEHNLTERESLLDWLTSLTPEQHENMLLEMMKIERFYDGPHTKGRFLYGYNKYGSVDP